jgi:hypothetical protein
MKKIKVIAALILFFNSLSAYAPTNFYRPYDIDFRKLDGHSLSWCKNNRIRVGVFAEYGTTNDSRDWDSNKKRLLQIYNETESSLAMLLGSPKGSFLDQLANSLGVSSATATDDNTRGHFLLSGTYEEFDCMLFGRYKLPIEIDGIFNLSLFVPFRSIKIKNVQWTDQTKDILTADKEFKDQVSSNIEQFARDNGCLNINKNGFEESGVGDVAIMLDWQKTYKQQDKEYLKNVCVNAGVGVTIPTSGRKDEDQSFSMPLGNDGAWGIPARIGLDLNFVWHLRAGIELSFLGLFDTTGVFRMKTERHQTDFLLLHKGNATKSQGPTWQFTLFGGAKKLYLKGLSAMIAYYFVKHDEDRFAPKSYNFDSSIVNSAQSLKEWSAHSFVFSATYAPIGLSLFYRLPITGKRSIFGHTFGGQIAFNF